MKLSQNTTFNEYDKNMSILTFIKSIGDNSLNYYVNKIITKNELRGIIRKSGKTKNPVHLREWYEKWKVLGRPNKDYYRVFSRYIGEDIDIVPDNISHNVITPILNPKRYISTYADKNLFDKFVHRKDGQTLTPHTLLRCIRSIIFDTNYGHIEEADLTKILSKESSIIVKPSIDVSSGKGVLFFDKQCNEWIERTTGEPLSIQQLFDRMGTDFIVQRTMIQSPFMAMLGKTSVNTIRMVVYRSVTDNRCHALRAIVRIGKDGSLVDNAHAGGMFVGVDDNGRLGKYCCNQFGETSNEFNGIDFKNSNLIIPNYDTVKSFAEEVGSYILHLRLLALDIMLDQKNNPILIEYNVKAFAPWLFQFSSGTAFGSYTDEIIDYCKSHKDEATRLFISF